MNRIETYFSTKIWHPYLILLYFVLKNAVDIHLPFLQWIEPVEVFSILAIIITILLYISKKTTSNNIKISIVITGALGIFFFTVPIFSTLKYFYPSIFHRIRETFTFSLAIWGIFNCYLLWNRKKAFVSLNYYLNILLITFCLFDLGKGFYEYCIAPTEVSVSREKYIKPKYGIYLIVLDGYASTKNLKKYWQFDNILFDNYLKQKSFFKIENSHSNYKFTVQTIGSCLNMDYLMSQSEPYMESQIKRNKVCKILNSLNYDCYMLDYNGIYYKYDAKKTKVEYKLLLYMQSAANIMLNTLNIDVSMKHGIINSGIFSEFKSYVEPSKKQFIYMHSMTTHDPFYDNSEQSIEKNDTILRRILKKIDADYWSFRNNNWRTIGSDHDDAYLKQIYLSKIKYTNQQTQNTLDSVWDTLKQNIVIVMSDHGFRLLPGAKVEATSESYDNFCAIYFPDKDYSTITDTITPINVIRMAMNKAINLKLPYLPDKTNL